MVWKEYPYIGQMSRQFSLSYRPLVEVELFGQAASHRSVALIDSGSEASLMDREIADVLGISAEGKPPVTVSGVSGEKQGFISPVSVRIEGFDELLTFNVIFIDEPSFDVIFGQQDFFRNFDVRFEHSRERFFLKSNTLSA